MVVNKLEREDNGRFIKGYTPSTAFKKGRTPWNKGKKIWSKEDKIRISNQHKGKKQSKETIEKRMSGGAYKGLFKKGHKTNIGRRLTDEQKNNLKIALKKTYDNGRVSWNKGIDWLKDKREGFADKKSKTMKRLYREGKMVSWFKENRVKQIFPIKDTSIEVKIQNFLSKLHLEFLTHKYISEITHSYQCDIFIPVQNRINQKIIIECDGCYWHGCPICNLNYKPNIKQRIELDELRTQELEESGFNVIRLWEHEIKKIQINKLRSLIYG